MERIPAECWRTHAGHVARYRYAAENIGHGECVNDIACGVGYGSELLKHTRYVGYDKPGVFAFNEMFYGCDINSETWMPLWCDVTVCFETLEHVENPARLARVIRATSRRAVFVSVPTQPTKHVNPWHLHDFTQDDIPPMFPDFKVKEVWPQPEELSHVWYFERLQ